ncbi:MAG: DUF2330 domain-containing protein [Myxococcales bacterium]|nr:DUF2330 domain-containing protein [Myxococcales bacterium]
MVFPDHVERVGGMSRQELLVDFQESSTVLTVSAGFVDASGELAFLLPLASLPDPIVDGDPELFAALDGRMAPRIYISDPDEDSSGGGGIGCAKAGALDGGGGDRGNGAGEVLVLDRGETDTYTYVIVGGDSEMTIVEWLGDNGFALPADFAAAIDSYAADGWYFLAAKVKPDAASGALAPLELSFPAAPPETFSIPLGVAAYSLPAGEDLDVTLYVNAAGGMQPASAEVTSVDANALVAVTASESNYKELFAEAAAGGAWVREFNFAGAYYSEDELSSALTLEQDALLQALAGDSRSLTRYRASLASAELRDVTFAPAADNSALDSTYWLEAPAEDEEGCRVTEVRGASLLALLLVLAWPRRRRRS